MEIKVFDRSAKHRRQRGVIILAFTEASRIPPPPALVPPLIHCTWLPALDSLRGFSMMKLVNIHAL